MTNLALVALLGGVLALDATSVGQFMLSRPLAAGVVTGWAVGDPVMGLEVGALLEVYMLVAFPTGGARFPEGATATVVAVWAAAGAGGPGAVPLGVALGLVAGALGGSSVSVLRRVNGRIVAGAEARPGPARRVARIHLSAVALDFARGAAVTLVGAGAARWVTGRFAPAWPLAPLDSRALLLVGGAVSAGILLRAFGGFRRRGLLLAAGVALGTVGARLL